MHVVLILCVCMHVYVLPAVRYKHDKEDNVTGYSSSRSLKDIWEIHNVVLMQP